MQGQGAAEEIAAAIDAFNRWQQVEVLIVGRGGGSLEDLWAFNEEVVARAIARSQLPVVSAVGHEIDYSISDFVADLRAPTPSAAAELVVPEMDEFKQLLADQSRRLTKSLLLFRLELKNRLTACSRSWVFREPRNLVNAHRQRVDRYRKALSTELRGVVRQRQQRIDEAGLRLEHLIQNRRQRARHRLEQIQTQLRLLGPAAVLERGYSITRGTDGHVIRKAADIRPGDRLTTLLAEGTVQSIVEENNS